jgi:serine/threonine-protein phosphatase 2A activator
MESIKLINNPFSRAREAILYLEEEISALKSLIISKNAIIQRLSVDHPPQQQQEQGQPQMQQQINQSSTMEKGIFNHQDLINFLASETCLQVLQFLSQLNSVVRGKRRNSSLPSGATSNKLPVDLAIDVGFALIDETPPEELDPQRFGNKAFRKWHSKLLDSLSLMTKDMELNTLFPKSFGDPHRLDFGTGHEATFLMLLLVIYQQEKQTDLLKHFVLVTLPRYFSLVRKLRLVYRLEPAGSHGVWSLDDYHFLPFILGSSQLCDGNTQPKDLLTNPSFSELDFDSDFFSDALLDILRSKRGPFREHSPLLFSLRNCSSWDELNIGLIKMWRGEVIGKFPVAQHFLFGPHLPITWQHSDGSDMSSSPMDQAAPAQPTGAVSTGAAPAQTVDPLAKYFNLDKSVAATPVPLVSTATVVTETPYTVSADGNGIDIGGWNITCLAEAKISGETELEALKNLYPTELDFPFPEMLFSGNFLLLEHSQNRLKLEFNAEEALRGCKLPSGVPPDRKLIKVTMAEAWEKRRDQDGNVIKTWRDDYDWTFTTRRFMNVSKNGGAAKLTRTPRRIDYEKLKQREPILWAKEILLFEDDLFDLGISKLSVKIRVMPSCYFVLARFFLRVDGTHLRCVDSRIFHVFGQKHVIIENSERESDFASLGASVETKDLVDPNYVASILPLVGEPISFEVNL